MRNFVLLLFVFVVFTVPLLRGQNQNYIPLMAEELGPPFPLKLVGVLQQGGPPLTTSAGPSCSKYYHRPVNPPAWRHPFAEDLSTNAVTRSGVLTEWPGEREYKDGHLVELRLSLRTGTGATVACVADDVRLVINEPNASQYSNYLV